MYERTGCIYSEMTNKGRSSVKYIRGCKPRYCFNWVGEIVINRKRYRKRNKSRAVIERWIEEMKVRYGKFYYTGPKKRILSEQNN